MRILILFLGLFLVGCGKENLNNPVPPLASVVISACKPLLSNWVCDDCDGTNAPSEIQFNTKTLLVFGVTGNEYVCQADLTSTDNQVTLSNSVPLIGDATLANQICNEFNYTDSYYLSCNKLEVFGHIYY